MRLMEEKNALRAGLRTLFAAPEFAPCRARSARLCVLTVREVEARGVGTRRDVRLIVQYGSQAERTEVHRGVPSPRWEGLSICFPIHTWSEDLLVTLMEVTQAPTQLSPPQP